MNIKLIAIIPLLLVSACTQTTSDTMNTTDLDGFCGSSTNAICAADSDCKPGGCSGQVCSGADENIITTCEYRECYNAEAYGVKCGCVEGKCRWYK